MVHCPSTISLNTWTGRVDEVNIVIIASHDRRGAPYFPIDIIGHYIIIIKLLSMVVYHHSSKVFEGLHRSPQILDHEVANEGSAAAFVLTNLRD